VSVYPPEPPYWEPVIALDHEGGTAAICRDSDGSLWLVWDLGDLSDEGDWDEEPPDDAEEWDPRGEFGDPLLGYETAGAGVTVDGVAALAGRLPDGATRVEVRDGASRPAPVAVDDGVWLALPDPTSQLERVVLFLDPEGRPVRRPLPEHVSVEPLAGVELECPGCGAQGWELASVSARSAGGPDPVSSYEWQPGAQAAVCCTCGFVQALPRRSDTQHIVIEGERLDPAEQRKRRRELAADVWERATAGLGTPPFGLARDWSGPRQIESWGGGAKSNPIHNITLEHGDSADPRGPWLSVTTSAYPSEDFEPVEQWLEDNLVSASSAEWHDPEGTDTPSSDLREELRRRHIQERVQILERQEIAVPIGKESASFLTLAFEDSWCAHGNHRGTSISIVARDFTLSQVALEAADVDMYLLR
jgi:hypothetical protein